MLPGGHAAYQHFFSHRKGHWEVNLRAKCMKDGWQRQNLISFSRSVNKWSNGSYCPWAFRSLRGLWKWTLSMGVCSCWGGGPFPKYDLILETSYYSALEVEPLGALEHWGLGIIWFRMSWLIVFCQDLLEQRKHVLIWHPQINTTIKAVYMKDWRFTLIIERLLIYKNKIKKINFCTFHILYVRKKSIS